MAISSIEAVDLLRFADVFSEKLASATAELSRKRGHEREKAWIEAGLGLVDEARKNAAGLVDRARGLPELSELREEFSGALQNAWVDAIEKLIAGITFHVSARSPIIEALFPHQKFAPLRKAPREVVEKFHKDYEKRLKSGYVTRMLATEDFAFAQPVLEQVSKKWAEFIDNFEAQGLPPDQAAPIRSELIAAATRVELAVRQARLLAEAALAPLNGAFEASGLAMKPKKRAKVAMPIEADLRGASDDTTEDSADDAESGGDDSTADDQDDSLDASDAADDTESAEASSSDGDDEFDAATASSRGDADERHEDDASASSSGNADDAAPSRSSSRRKAEPDDRAESDRDVASAAERAAAEAEAAADAADQERATHARAGGARKSSGRKARTANESERVDSRGSAAAAAAETSDKSSAAPKSDRDAPDAARDAGSSAEALNATDVPVTAKKPIRRKKAKDEAAASEATAAPATGGEPA